MLVFDIICLMINIDRLFTLRSERADQNIPGATDVVAFSDADFAPVNPLVGATFDAFDRDFFAIKNDPTSGPTPEASISASKTETDHRRRKLVLTAVAGCALVGATLVAWGVKGTLEEEHRIDEVRTCVSDESNGQVSAEYDRGRGAFTGPTEHMDLIAECEAAAR